MKKLIILVAYTVLCSCIEEGTNTSKIQEAHKQQRPDHLNNQPVPQEVLKLNNPEDQLVSGNSEIEGNLFGKFFYDRAEFFIIENPTNELYDSKVNSITMYYLDGRLSQTKYILEGNVAAKLIRAYGNFKITGYDPVNRELMKSLPVLLRTKELLAINNAFDNYELKWVIENKQITFRVNTSDPKERYTYTEKLMDYENSYNEIERSGI